METAVLLAVLTLLSNELGAFLSPAHSALLCITAVVVGGIRHGLTSALLISASSMMLMSFYHLEPRLSFRASRVEDWVTLLCFGIASFLTGNLTARFRRQLEHTRAIADHNELLYGASQVMAGADQQEQLVRGLLDASASVTEQETVLLLPAHRMGDERAALRDVVQLPEPRAAGSGVTQLSEGAASESSASQLALAHAWTGSLTPEACAAAEAVYRGRSDAPVRGPDGWLFVPMIGQRGPLGVMGARLPDARSHHSTDQTRALSALCRSAGVALERCRLSEEIRANQMSADAERLRSALLSSVSHDLRTPLASIIGATSAIRDLGDTVRPADQTELLSMVLEEARRLDRFVGNLLDMTRIGSGKLRPHFAWCDVRDVIAEVVRSLHVQLASPPLEVTVAPDFPLLYVDAVLLERVVENLVHNAAKHSGSERAVALTAECLSSRARICVIDAGTGIARAAEARRDPILHRAGDTDHRTGGSGMGLAICHAFTQAMGGALVLRDGPGGRGLCAEIQLPIVPAEPGSAEKENAR